MTESLDYILKKIEQDYLTSNSASLKDGNLKCLKDASLPCNCIPGIIVNLSAFLTMLFFDESPYEAKLEIVGGNGYIQCYEGVGRLFPITGDERDGKPYVLKDRICRESNGEHAYIPFRPYSELQAIQADLDKITEILSMYPADAVRLELSIRLLCAMRTRPLSQSSKVFLLMVAYLSPKRIMRLMYGARNTIGRDWLRQFMLVYVKFLQDIDDDAPLGFNQRLNKSFRKAVGFDIAAFLESLEPAGKMYEEVLISAYRSNVNDISRRHTHIRRICKYVSDSEINDLIDSFSSI